MPGFEVALLGALTAVVALLAWRATVALTASPAPPAAAPLPDWDGGMLPLPLAVATLPCHSCRSLRCHVLMACGTAICGDCGTVRTHPLPAG